MSNKNVFKLQAEVCKALAHPLRIEIIDLLQEKEKCFTDILESTGELKSNLSQHLSIMVKCGILQVRKDSRCNYYSLSSFKVSKACSLMREVLIDNHNKNKKILMPK